MDRKNQRLVEVLKTLEDRGAVSLNGRLVLGHIVGDLRQGGFYEPGLEFEGDVSLTKIEGGYWIRAGEHDERIITSKPWILCQRPAFHYSTSLRRGLRNEPHLMLGLTDANNQRYHFGVLYGINGDHQ